jgi:hypothetical protein
MAAVQANSFTFVLGNVSFEVEKEVLEMYPGCDALMVTIACNISLTRSEAGVCLRS